MESFNKISSNLELIIEELKLKRISINYIFITGGLSNNRILKEQMKNKFEENLIINYFSSYENIISNGAVLYGINSTKLLSRFYHENIGIKIKNKVEFLIKKGSVMNNYIIKNLIIKPFSNTKNIVQLNIYASENELMNENDFIGRLLIYLENSKEVKLEIKYDVVLSFKAYEYKNNKILKTKFEYFKKDIYNEI